MCGGFNPRAREGRDLEMENAHLSNLLFQSTRPRGARQRGIECLMTYGKFQSTRPRGARLCQTTQARNITEVSIHAPARGATVRINSFCIARNVSIHAPARGATCVANGDGGWCHVSIHAPARGATILRGTLLITLKGFNPRAREGRDQRCTKLNLRSVCFNPRAREGRDSVWP